MKRLLRFTQEEMNRAIVTKLKMLTGCQQKRNATNLHDCRQETFVPKHEEAQESDIRQLSEMLRRSRNLLVLTGAGISTESGIPDYRSEGVGLYSVTKRRPVQYQDFLKSELARKRYWARNYVAWNRFSSFQPNGCHLILSNWEKRGLIYWLVTQNVDALHTKAGHINVTELHGCTHRVECLVCGNVISRYTLQDKIASVNTTWNANADQTIVRPDGDIDLSDEQCNEFQMPDCERCGGLLKPQVVFFGDNVPKMTVDFVYNKVNECDTFLVLGSSLYVYSGFRFVSRARQQQKNIAIVTIGDSRADNLADIKVNARCGEILNRLDL